ncbi:Phosphatidate cytidylyltransferase [Arsenophonus endosymbiont of Aleurodicus floccissimus]|uniref:phosphatidate cytidylyltransferase n=1 Tax=Arsenophonus endosymbiont of Aleurodicus floccissimus TaxID=2152761 RepID=UPI000EDE7AFF|nr:phosphatidate cytidylyltransferase [Arsenophonus endosymbiont of Aleurodicus floccissimus]SPP32228.1 Phosphatidate cytidylyltransferase [Arsenophonus endosymbiont of Aleurodicus floccissimus]
MLNLNARIITAIILIPLVIAALFFLPPNLFGYVIIVICSLAAWEWSQFIGWTVQIKRIISAVLFGICLLGLQLSFQDLSQLTMEPLIIYILSAGLVWWLVAIILVVTFPTSARFWSQSVILKIFFGVLTILPFYCGMLVLKSADYHIGNFIGAWWVFYVMLLVWSADSGAYFFGHLFGKHKLAAKVSPGKTLEGMLGGMLTAGIIAWLFSLFVPVLLISNNLLFCSVIVVIISVFGDLTESMFKRQAGIKNSSHLIPGHGGVLDRIDSLTVAIPVFAGLTLLFF